MKIKININHNPNNFNNMDKTKNINKINMIN